MDTELLARMLETYANTTMACAKGEHSKALALAHSLRTELAANNMPDKLEPTHEHIVAFLQASRKCAQDCDDDMSPEYRGLEAVFRMLGNNSAAKSAAAEQPGARAMRECLRHLDIINSWLANATTQPAAQVQEVDAAMVKRARDAIRDFWVKYDGRCDGDEWDKAMEAGLKAALSPPKAGTTACEHDYWEIPDDRLPGSWIDVCAKCGHERGVIEPRRAKKED